MTKIFRSIVLLLSLISFRASAQTADSLRQKIQQIISTKNSVVGVAIIGNNGKDTVSINGEKLSSWDDINNIIYIEDVAKNIEFEIVRNNQPTKLFLSRKDIKTFSDEQFGIYPTLNSGSPF